MPAGGGKSTSVGASIGARSSGGAAGFMSAARKTAGQGGATLPIGAKLWADTSGFVPRITTASYVLSGFRITMGRTIAGLGAFAGIQGLKGATNAAIEYEVAVANIAKVTDEFTAENVGEQLKKMADEMPVVREELFLVAENAARLGIRGVENITEFTRVAGMIGVATDLSADRAADAFARILKMTDTSVDQFEAMASGANELSNQMATTFSEIVNAVRRAAPTLTQLGLTAPEVFAVSAALNEVSESAERAGTRLLRLGQELMDPRVINRLARELGTTEEALIAMREASPVELIKSLALALRESGVEAEGVRTALTVVAQKGVAALGQNLEGLEKALQMANTEWENATSLQTEYTRFASTTESANVMIANSWKNMATEAGDHLLPQYNNLLGIVSKMIDQARTLISLIPDHENMRVRPKTPEQIEADQLELFRAISKASHLTLAEVDQLQRELNGLASQIAQPARADFLRDAEAALREFARPGVDSDLITLQDRVNMVFESYRKMADELSKPLDTSGIQRLENLPRRASEEYVKLLGKYEQLLNKLELSKREIRDLAIASGEMTDAEREELYELSRLIEERERQAEALKESQRQYKAARREALLYLERLREEWATLGLTDEAVRELTISRLKLTDAERTEARDLSKKIALKEAEIEREKELQELRKKAWEAIREGEAKQREEERKATEAAIKARERAKLAEMIAEWNLVKQAAERMADDLDDAFVKILSGAVSLKDGIREMVADILSELAKLALRKALTEPLIGWFGQLISDAWGIPKPPGKFSGGYVRANEPVFVGEGGRPEVFVAARDKIEPMYVGTSGKKELFVPPVAGRIYPESQYYNQTEHMATGGFVSRNKPVFVGEGGRREMFVPSGVTHGAQASDARGETVVVQTLNFNFTAADAVGLDQLLMKRAGTIRTIVAEESRRSSRFRRNLVGGRRG